jgi:hypothetical protein
MTYSVVQRIQFLWRRLLDFERVLTDVGDRASGGWRGIPRKESLFPFGAILVPHRSLRMSKTRWLIGTHLLPSFVLLSGTNMTRLSQSRFSMRFR